MTGKVGYDWKANNKFLLETWKEQLAMKEAKQPKKITTCVDRHLSSKTTEENWKRGVKLSSNRVELAEPRRGLHHIWPRGVNVK